MIKHNNMEFTILTIFKCKVWWHWICCQIKGRINRERKAEDRERLLLQSHKRLTCAHPRPCHRAQAEDTRRGCNTDAPEGKEQELEENNF